ncbi:MAG TPA: glycosyl hydrolase family 32 [Firmicutes bacterium]|jgi:hypothetical protein|nr:glycosyl hydrolase family 32 [Bacillota bacterium]
MPNQKDAKPEVLYNGIELPDVWPPKREVPGLEPMEVPYLDNPPVPILIDVGRQLFVDDFLIEETNLSRSYHQPKKYEGNPVLKPTTKLEGNGTNPLPFAAPVSGGIWWDDYDQMFKIWYQAGFCQTVALATSRDGIHWHKPTFDVVPGTNQVLPPGLYSDSSTVFIDYDTEHPEERYKMLVREPQNQPGAKYEPKAALLTSADGIHWVESGVAGAQHDRSTMFYNPFRKRWVFSVKATTKLHGRCRRYWERASFLEGYVWDWDEPTFWACADNLDLPDPEIGDTPQLYNLDAVAYESLMLGMFQIHKGPRNSICMQKGAPKTTELYIAFSRDGFHWHRPPRKAFIGPVKDPESWERGYIQSVGALCLVVDDQLRFYYAGAHGDKNLISDSKWTSGTYANVCTGMATLRRDGFCSMDAGTQGGVLTTQPVEFSGRHLFVNVDAPEGTLKVEVLDESGTVIAPYGKENCHPVTADSTKQQVVWQGAADLAPLAGKIVRFRFHLRNAKLYSFWVSRDATGKSAGYMAGGGPGFAKGRDI